MRMLTGTMLLWLAACGGTPAGGSAEPTPPAGTDETGGTAEPGTTGGEGDTEGEGTTGPGETAEPADPCAAVAELMCEIQGVEDEACAALAARVAERGLEYCTRRLPDTRAQVQLSQTLLREEVPVGQEIPLRQMCGEAERTVRPTAPDPTGGTFTIEEALAGLPGEGNPHARIITRIGTLDCELFADRAPRTVANFVGLARGLRPFWDPCTKEWRRGPYYDGLQFHRVIPGFMIQGGDILGSGEGDGGYEFADEFEPTLRHDRPGVMSMANSGPNTNGTQFFVTEGPTRHLDDKHSVFGLCRHAGVVARIARESRGEGDRPTVPVPMKIEIYR